MNYVTIVKEDWLRDKHFQQNISGIYNTKSLRHPYRMTIAMLCRLYGEKDATHFKFEWSPLIYHVTMRGVIFNWADIISDSLEEEMLTVQS